ncbi:MAG TPA: OmpA family protein [Candidatus Kapabacteria bacterium]|nr:OmpA family protein [Candidatus Kapabacteria bacterium]
MKRTPAILFSAAAFAGLTFAWCAPSAAQTPAAAVPPMYVGGGISGAFNEHVLGVPVYRADTLCGVFRSGTSILPSGFLLFEKPLGDPAHSLWIAPRLHLTDLGATITTPSTDAANVRSPVDSSLVPVTQFSQIDATLVSLGADLFVKYPMTARLFLFGGPSIGFLLRNNWDVFEDITSPSQAVFSQTGTQTRTVTGGQIPNSTSVLFTATLGASLDVPLSPKVVLAPELSVTAPINSIRTDYPWRVWSVALGAAIKFNIAPEPKMEVLAPPPPPEKPVSALSASVQISGVIRDSSGNEVEIPNPQIRIEEFLKREAFPTLNYIFFANDSSRIPSRYHLFDSPEAAQAFDITKLSGESTLQIYHDELNILGKRLADSSNITITVTGTNSDTAAADTTVARRRAESVRDYFVNIWKIDPNRIVVKSEALPQNPSPAATAAGAEENQRVEIISSNPTFLDPLTVETIDRTMNPPIIRLRANYSSRITLAESTLALKQGDRVLTSYRAPGAMVQWNPNPDDLPRTDTPLVASMHLTDSLGATYEASDTAHVELLTIRKKREERVKDKIIEDYNLITFEFDKSDLNDRSRRVIAEIAKSVAPNTHIVIKGYTDVTGESVHNLALSQARAAAVAAALKESLGAQAASVTFDMQGEGQDDLVDNRLPEGRFLSRTVFVELRKPVE